MEPELRKWSAHHMHQSPDMQERKSDMNLLQSNEQTNYYVLVIYILFIHFYKSFDGIVIMQLQFMWKSSRSQLWDTFLNG